MNRGDCYEISDQEGPVLWVMGQSFNVIGKKKVAIASRIKKKRHYKQYSIHCHLSQPVIKAKLVYAPSPTPFTYLGYPFLAYFS